MSVLFGLTLYSNNNTYSLDAASQNQCHLKKGAFYSLGSIGAYLILGVAFIAMRPYRDAGAFFFCCFSTRAAASSRTMVQSDDKGEGDTTSEDDGDQNTQKRDDDEEDGLVNASDMFTNDRTSADTGDHNNGEADNDDEMTIDKYSQHQEDTITENLSMDGKVDIMGLDEDAVTITTTTKGDGGGSVSSTTSKGHTTNVSPPAPQSSDYAEILSNETIETEQTRSPDFLDVCCGDPLELEKYLGMQRGGMKSKLVTN